MRADSEPSVRKRAPYPGTFVCARVGRLVTPILCCGVKFWPVECVFRFFVDQTSYRILPSNDSTLAVEVYKTGLMKRKKHLLFFESFRGELDYVSDCPERSQVKMVIDSASLICRDKWLSTKKQTEITRYARNEILQTDRYPRITFASDRITAKRIRGFIVVGALTIRGTMRTVNLNLVVNQTKPQTLQIDGDAGFRLSEFGVQQPSALLGLIGTKDEVLIRLLLWATRST
jgi:polyisoprenoid-binding protein YceI